MLIPPIDTPYIILPMNPNIVYVSFIDSPMENNKKANPKFVFKMNKSLFLPQFYIFVPNKSETIQIANGDIANIKPIVMLETPISYPI